jgi:RNA polymerase sigma factor (sigma-70 family)
MSTPRSVTIWIEELKRGGHSALARLDERYRDQLVRLARRRLASTPRRVADEEDVAQSALRSFWSGAVAGRFSQLRTREDLWPLLQLITQRKAIDYARRELRLKRGNGKVRGESALRGNRSTASGNGFARIAAEEPSPASAVEAAERYMALLEQLDDESLRKIAVWKTQGHTNEEIAQMLPCSRATVARKLAVIRRIWRAQCER